ncbi:MAG: PilZ domain-containing protein [Kofleriaceae bacterium]
MPLDRIEPRVPFFAPVVATGLSRCWATNLSAGGIGLTALVGNLPPPERGDELELELVLGDSKTALRVIGRVAWTSHVRPHGRLGLGAQFHELAPGARTALAMFLAHQRPRTLIALASQAERELVTALQDIDVELVDDPNTIDEAMLRSCASIVVFSHEEPQLAAFLDLIAKRTGGSTLPVDVPLAPVTVCTTIDSETLLPMFSDGRIYQVLRPPFDRRALRLAVERSCERWAVQVELRWASLQLEGLALARQHLPAHATQLDARRRNTSVIRESDAMERVYELIATVAVHDVPVLLMGETGTRTCRSSRTTAVR